jgi:dienelactone hydrolase
MKNTQQMGHYFIRATKLASVQAVVILIMICCGRFSAVAQTKLWDLRQLSKAPAFKWLDTTSNIRSLSFQSVDFKGARTEVFAYYSDPDVYARKKTGHKFPGVVLAHGGGGMAFRQWVEKWAAAGYAAIAIDFGGKDGNGKKMQYPGPEPTEENQFKIAEKETLKDAWTYHSVSSIILAHSWLLAQPQIQKNKTAITGISWGGYLTCLAASVDNRFKAAVPVYGCGYYDESDAFKVQLKTLSAEAQRRWMTYLDPSAYLASSKMPFLFLNGNKDAFYNVVPYHKTYQLVNKSRRSVSIIPDMLHSHIDGWEPVEIKAFIDQELYGKRQLAKVKKVSETPSHLLLHYQPAVPLASAAFYYSNDVTSTNAQRRWIRQDAAIDAKKKIVSTPQIPGGFKYGFFHLKDIKNQSVSGEFIIK